MGDEEMKKRSDLHVFFSLDNLCIGNAKMVHERGTLFIESRTKQSRQMIKNHAKERRGEP